MNDLNSLIVIGTSSLLIIMGILWRFSILFKLIIEKYSNDGKIDEKEFFEIIGESLKFLKYLFKVFNISFESLYDNNDILNTE